MKIFASKELQVFARLSPDYMVHAPKIIPRVKNHKLNESDIAKIKELRPNYSVKQLAKQFNCSPLAISMYAPRKDAAIKLEKEKWDSSPISRQLTKIRKFQRKAAW
eukprot:NODE_357_length_10221_cov_0.563130.p9 type:complete len:106 gc:universal NODE_357_length_10221_cov_0.563130:4741-5058(+)